MKAEIAFKGSGIRFATFLLRMVNGPVASKLAVELRVVFGLIGHEAAFLSRVRIDDRFDVGRIGLNARASRRYARKP
jgi:hypothetical protein